LPSDAEWKVLTDYVKNTKNCNSVCSNHLKAINEWKDGIIGLDSYGFSAMPSGTGSSDNYFDNIGTITMWWSTSELGATSAYYRIANGNINSDLTSNASNKRGFISVRCLKDNTD
jgi:uncharacterized protein (TIGR02145 family)